MIFELRIYHIKPGHRDQWVDLMERTIIPFQITMGMTIIGSFISRDDPDHYIWIRRFKNEEERLNLYDAVYGSDTWKKEIRPAMGDMLIREEVDVRMMEPTPSSWLQ